MRHELIRAAIYNFLPDKTDQNEWDLDGLRTELGRLLALEDLPINEWLQKQSAQPAEDLIDRVTKVSDEWMEEKHKDINPKLVRELEKSLLLQTIDQLWKEHLQALDYLKRSIMLRAYGQKDPLNEYKREAFLLFETMLDKVHEQAVILLTHAQLRLVPATTEAEETDQSHQDIDFSKVGRNEPCPCGSGKKFKHCHGKIDV